MTTEQDRLVESHFGMVKSIAGKLSGRNPAVGFDELVSEGGIGIMRAAEKYDPKRGIKFSTFAYKKIWGAMMDLIRAVAENPQPISLDAVCDRAMAHGELHGRPFLRWEPQARPDTMDHDEEWDRFLAPLDYRSRGVVLRFAKGGWSQSAIAREYGLSQGIVSRIIRMAAGTLMETTMSHLVGPNREAA